MAEVTFFFDPVCPWAWRTSQWIREVQRQRELTVHWRFFSLALANNYAEERPQYLTPLRIAAQARIEGGDEAVNQVYLAIGIALHERGADTQADGAFERILPAALKEAGLDETLISRALANPETLATVTAETEKGKGQYAAFGVPWLVMENHDLGFFGPIVNPVPTGQEALDLWDHTAWLFTRPYLFEIKRERV